MSEERPTGRMRWVRVSYEDASHDTQRPAAIKLQVEVEETQHGWAEDSVIRSWRDVPLVDENCNELSDKLHMPMWKLD